MFLRNLFCAVLATVALAACGSDLSTKDLAKGATLGVADPDKPVVGKEYRLGPRDIIEVEVFNFPALKQSLQLDTNGEVVLSLIGRVDAAGKTAQELSDLLEARYGDKYLQHPQVSVLVKSSKVETITVDGSVQQPGVYQVGEKTTLVKALAMAKGLDQLANPKQVVVFRYVNDQRVAGVFDLSAIRGGQASDPPIYPNDTIVVASSAYRRTLRDIVGATPLVALLPLF